MLCHVWNIIQTKEDKKMLTDKQKIELLLLIKIREEERVTHNNFLKKK